MQSSNDSLELHLPWPSSRLSPNSPKRHWRWKQRAKVAAYERAQEVARLASISHGYKPPDGSLVLHMEFCPPDHRRRDLDNLLASMKPSIDGVCAALSLDDSKFCRIVIDWGLVHRRGRVILKLSSFRKDIVSQ